MRNWAAIAFRDSHGTKDIQSHALSVFSGMIHTIACQQYPLTFRPSVRITFNSDWDMAESILIDAARKAASDIITVTKQEPYVRSEMYDYGVMMRLRYTTLATDRPRIAHEITKRIFKEFRKNGKVDFAIPYLYSSKTPFSPSETKPRTISTAPIDLWKR